MFFPLDGNHARGTVGRMNPTHPAIIVLQEALHTCENNEPINRKEGNLQQAELEAVNAAHYRQAIAILEVIFGRAAAPIWPEPKSAHID